MANNARMVGKTNRFPCCDFCDSARAPHTKKKFQRAWKRAERQTWKRQNRLTLA